MSSENALCPEVCPLCGCKSYHHIDGREHWPAVQALKDENARQGDLIAGLRDVEARVVAENKNLKDERDAALAKVKEPEWWHPVDVSIEVSDIWFWWNGEQTFPVNILNDGKELWACCGQWGWSRAQRLTDMGGLWTPCIRPEPNKVQQGEAIIVEGW